MAALNENQTDVHATMAKDLPHYVIIQSNYNHRYLHYYTGNKDTPDSFRYAGDYSFGVDTRFEVVQAKTGNGLVHIRCVQNNKYWAKLSGANKWVTTMADKPEEDVSNEYCTLFQPIFMYEKSNHVLRLRHVSSKNYVCYFDGAPDYNGLLYLTTQFIDRQVCTFINWKDVVMLPDRIRLIGDNGNHLRACEDTLMDFNLKASWNFLSFEFEVYPSRDGGIRLKSAQFGTYWTGMDDERFLHLKEASSSDHDTGTVFLPSKASGGKKDGDKDEDETVRIKLKCLKNGKFAKRFKLEEYGRNYLATIVTYPDEWCNFVIEEPYISRRIENVRYDFSALKRYNENTTAIFTSGGTYATEGTSTLELTTEVTNTSSWSLGDTTAVGGKVTFTADTPSVATFGVEVSGEDSRSVKSGKENSETVRVGSVKTVKVKPGTRLMGALMETRLSYDIPYSYTQRDVLMDGSTKLTERNDGMFTGNNGYGYRYEIVNLDLPPK